MELFPKIMDLITTTTPADTGNTAVNVPPTSTNENQPPRMNGHYNDTDTDTGTNDMVDAQSMSSPYVMATTTTITTTMKRGKPTTTPAVDNDIVDVAPNDVTDDAMDRTESTMVTVSPRIVNMATTTIGTTPPPSGGVRRSPRRHHYHDSPTVALLPTTATIAPRSRTTLTIPTSTQKKARTNNVPVLSTIPIRNDDSPMMITTITTGVLPCSNGDSDSDGGSCAVVVPTPPLLPPPPNNNISVMQTTTTISMTVDQIHSRMYQLFGSSPPTEEPDASGTTTTTTTATTTTTNTSSSDLIFHRVRCVCCIYIYIYIGIDFLVPPVC
jgi:hypothetical protein